MLLENERWLSPLGDEVRSALSAALTQSPTQQGG
ncbi:ABC-type transport auxiliary lipoprotein family protein [Serratia ficaria]|nr:ABC-type transport auxiliary lipoprotein family protein [Serratia ficaria]